MARRALAASLSIAVLALLAPACAAFSSDGAGGGSGCPNDLPKSCPANHPTYNDVEPILQANCVTCHGPGGVQENQPFTSYDDIVPQGGTSQVGAMLDQVYSCRMPQGSTLAPEDRATLLTWFVCQAPFN